MMIFILCEVKPNIILTLKNIKNLLREFLWEKILFRF